MQCNNVKIFVFLIFLEIFIRDFMNILYLWFLSFFSFLFFQIFGFIKVFHEIVYDTIFHHFRRMFIHIIVDFSNFVFEL